MLKRTVSGIMLTLLLVGMLTLVFNIRSVKSEPKTWTVDDDGPADFHMIQEAINASSPGDIIYVKAGTYYEHIVINKTLSLVGENKYFTIIDANLTSISVVLLTVANHVSIRGFTLINSQPIHCLVGGGIYLVYSNGTSINDNIIRNNQKGINLEYSVDNIIIGNDIIENNVGIQFLDNSGNSIIYHNNFNSSIQTPEAQNATNIWDNGFEGNYWSDYNGVDSDSDGIGDTPYVIDDNNIDRYPLMILWSMGWTRIGENVPVVPSYGISVTFENVTASGTTTINATAVGPIRPSGFILFTQPPVYYDINTTAGYSGTIAIAIPYNDAGMTVEQENSLQLMHWNETLQEWLDITTYIDTENNIIYGKTNYLSPFAIMLHTIPGDLNGDFTVSLSDLVILAQAYNSRPNEPKWNPNADIDGDNYVGLSDLVILAINYGKTYP